MDSQPVLVRITTIPLSLEVLLTGQMKYMKEHGFEVYMISSPGSGIKQLEERENCQFLAVKMTRTISPVKDLISIYSLVKTLKALRPTIVHTHTPKAGFVGMIAAYICNVPVKLHTVAGLPLMEAKGIKKHLLVWIEKLTYAFADYIYPNSLELKRYIIENKFTSSSKLKVLGNGSSNGINVNYFKKTTKVSEEAEQLMSKYDITSSNLVFIFVGRVVKDKGINELVNAFDRLNTKYKSIKLIIVGPFEDDLDPINPDTRILIDQNKNIIITGFINDIRPYLALSHVLAFPSYREGFPNVPLQAGCFELPMIVTDINGCNEIVQDGVNGLLVPPKDDNALQIAMEKMIANEAFRNRCATASRQIIVENYSRESVWNALLKEYENLLQAKGICLNYVSKIPETSI